VRSERERTHAARHLPDDVPERVKAARLQEVIAAFREGLESRFAAGAEGHKIVRLQLCPPDLHDLHPTHNLHDLHDLRSPIACQSAPPFGQAHRTPSLLALGLAYRARALCRVVRLQRSHRCLSRWGLVTAVPIERPDAHS